MELSLLHATHTSTHTHAHTRTHTRTHTCTHTHSHACTHTHTHTRTHTHAHTHTHTHTQTGALLVPVQSQVLPGHLPSGPLPEPQPEGGHGLHATPRHHHYRHVPGTVQPVAGFAQGGCEWLCVSCGYLAPWWLCGATDGVPCCRE